MEYLNRVHSSEAGIFTDEDGNQHFTGDLLEPYRDHINKHMFWGFDFDTTMLRVSSMNMMLHGVNGANIRYQDSLSKSIRSTTRVRSKTSSTWCWPTRRSKAPWTKPTPTPTYSGW